MSMNQINSASFDKDVLGDESFKIMFVGAPWCGHCQAMKPGVMEFSTENPDVSIFYSDADESPELMEKLEIRSIPTTFVFKDKKEVFRKVGALTKNDLADLVTQYR